MNFSKLKILFKSITSEKTNITIGNLSYSAIIALAPTIIIVTSLLSLMSKYFNLSEIESFNKLFQLSKILNLNSTTSIIINLICINLISSGIFSLLSIFQRIYKIEFKNYIRKKLYSITLAIIILLAIILTVTISFFLFRNSLLQKIDFFINFITIFLSILFFYKLATFQKLKSLYPGALISALLLTILLSFFYYVVDNFSNMQHYYGLLTPIISLVLSIYYSCYILYIGILLNVMFHKN